MIKDNCVSCGKKIKVTKIGKEARYMQVGNYCSKCNSLCQQIAHCKSSFFGCKTAKERKAKVKELRALIAKAPQYTNIPAWHFTALFEGGNKVH